MHKIIMTLFVLCAGLLPGASAVAQECPFGASDLGDYCVSEDGDYWYTESDDTITINRYVGSGGDVVIPNTINSLPVVGIDSWTWEMFRGWYEGAFLNSSVTSVIIPDSVTTLGYNTFLGCTGLTSMTIPGSVTSLGYDSFSGCTGLTSMTIPGSMTSISNRAFKNCTALTTAYFLGNAPTMGTDVFLGTAPDFQICYTSKATGFSTPLWEGYPAAPCADAPPKIDGGPYLAKDAWGWPVLPTEQSEAWGLNRDYFVVWTFSDDESCACMHVAEYQAIGDSEWSTLEVTSDDEQGFAYVELPIESLQNATTYAFRFLITDCADQTITSETYYFRVVLYDDPPVIEAGPYLAAWTWPVLPTSASGAFVLSQDYVVLWTFSDDYATCDGACTHRARYRKIVDDGSWIWEWLPVETDPEGTWYAYTTLPVASSDLEPGDYMFYFDVLDCAGQRTGAPKVYYFKVQ